MGLIRGAYRPGREGEGHWLGKAVREMDEGRPATDRAATWLARAAFAAAAAAVGLLVGVAGLRGIGLLAVGAAGAAAGIAGLWWFLTRRGLRRLAAAAVTIAAPVTVVTLYGRAGLLWLVLTCGALSIAAAAAGRAALQRTGRAEDAQGSEVPPPLHPFLIMNPRSGGGKVQRCDLARKARALGAEVVLLDEAGTSDVAALARRAVRAGADLLGVAAGDGTQAAVAAVAVDNDLPFLVIPAGTRNHFAMDLGLDRADPASGLDALTNGVEIRTDVGLVNDRMFVNNASFGVYAALVQSPAYRDDKAGTALDLLPDLLTAGHDPPLRLRAGQTLVSGPPAILVSNNPYAVNDVIGAGRRERLTDGVLGVLAVSANNASDAVRLMRGGRSKGLTRCTADEIVVDADTPWIPAGVDGESARLSTPVRCRIRPGALRVRVPRNRPGRRPGPPLDWRRLGRLAFPPAGAGRERRPGPAAAGHRAPVGSAHRGTPAPSCADAGGRRLGRRSRAAGRHRRLHDARADQPVLASSRRPRAASGAPPRGDREPRHPVAHARPPRRTVRPLPLVDRCRARPSTRPARREGARAADDAPLALEERAGERRAVRTGRGLPRVGAGRRASPAGGPSPAVGRWPGPDARPRGADASGRRRARRHRPGRAHARAGRARDRPAVRAPAGRGGGRDRDEHTAARVPRSWNVIRVDAAHIRVEQRYEIAGEWRTGRVVSVERGAGRPLRTLC
ncbi:hypothetical protein GCM10027610_058980 [Dactylosporangium cerinum]